MQKVLVKNTKKENQLFIDAVGGNKEDLSFLLEWLKNGRNATKAYLKLHPDVHYNSARVLASRQLTKVNVSNLFSFFGLGIESYMNQLKEGLNAKTPMNEPDHNARFPYLKVLGEVLGFTSKRS